MAFSMITNMIADAMVLNTVTGGTDYINKSTIKGMVATDQNGNDAADMSGVNTVANSATMSATDSSDIGMLQFAFNLGGSLLRGLNGYALLGDQVVKILPALDYTNPTTGVTTHYTGYYGQQINNAMAWLFILTAFQVITGKLLGLIH